MARKPRLHAPGGFYHVMLRGNNGQPIFFSETDRCRLSLLIQEVCERFNFRIHGFCFMKNHIHLILQVSENHISSAMQNLSSRYTRYINRKEKRIGHLFQGRFKSILIEDSDYLLQLIRYVHLNPVRAGIVAKPEHYPWSGHRAYLGAETILWLTQDWILAKFDDSEFTARRCYEKYVNEESLAEIPLNRSKRVSHQDQSLNNDDFVGRVLAENHQRLENPVVCSLEDILEVVCQQLDKPVVIVKSPGKERVSSKARALVSYFIKRMPHLTLKEFADFSGRDVSSLSKLARDMEVRNETEEGTALLISELAIKLKHCALAP